MRTYTQLHTSMYIHQLTNSRRATKGWGGVDFPAILYNITFGMSQFSRFEIASFERVNTRFCQTRDMPLLFVCSMDMGLQGSFDTIQVSFVKQYTSLLLHNTRLFCCTIALMCGIISRGKDENLPIRALLSHNRVFLRLL